MQVAHIYVDTESNDNSPLVAMAGLRTASVSLHSGTADLIDGGGGLNPTQAPRPCCLQIQAHMAHPLEVYQVGGGAMSEEEKQIEIEMLEHSIIESTNRLEELKSC